MLLMVMMKEVGTHLAMAGVAQGVCHLFKKSSASKLETIGLDAMTVYFVASCCHILAIYSVGMAMCHGLGIEVSDMWTSLLTSSSFVIGMASKNVLENLACGLMLIFTRPFEVGDQVNVAGVKGKIVRVGFFQTQIVDAQNEGHILPNREVNGSLESYMTSYDNSTHQLRQSKATLLFPVDENLENIYQVLERVGPIIDKRIVEWNEDKSKKDFPTGLSTLEGYYGAKYGRNLAVDQKEHKAEIHCKGQEGGFVFEVSVFCETTLQNKVSQMMFREAVKVCQDPKNTLRLFS